MLANIITTSLLATLAVAFPAPLSKRNGYSTDIEIHSSCNATQRRMIQQGLDETFEVATFARDYIHQHGASDPIFQLYFGTKPEAYPAVVGVYDALLQSNKDGVLFRCDNPDGNCGQPGWRGHYRGTNATLETVICDLSYTDRLYNAAFCMHGFELASTAPSTYWSIDLMHRLFHVPVITAAAVNHYAEDLDEVFELAVHNSTFSPFDSDALQYFSAHVYALEVVGGGDKCIGDIKGHEHHHHEAPASTTGPAPAPTSEAPKPDQSSEVPAPAPTKAQDCHTHADGTVHCV